MSLTNNPFETVKLIAAIKRDRSATQNISYFELPMVFRGYDEQVLYEVFLDQEYSFLGQFITEKSTPIILDIGAHIGGFAIWVLSLNKNSILMSLEADPETFKVAEANAKVLCDMGLYWHVSHGAASAIDGQNLPFSNEGPSMSHKVNESGNIYVPSVSFGSLLRKATIQGFEYIDLMKVDIEGAEEDFLCCEPALLKNVGNLVVELHPDCCNTDEVIRVLKCYFANIEYITGRQSSKPLLHCFN